MIRLLQYWTDIFSMPIEFLIPFIGLMVLWLFISALFARRSIT